MLTKIPFADPSPDPEHQREGSTAYEVPVAKSKAAFQWPPDCAWPFGDEDGTARSKRRALDAKMSLGRRWILHDLHIAFHQLR